MMTIHNICLATLLLWSLSFAASADSEAGKRRAAGCQGCHGAEGVSSQPLVPSLAGQQADYLAAQLHKFKTGERTSPIMESMASGLSDADILDLSAYFASLPAKTTGALPTLGKQGKDKIAMCQSCHGAKLHGQGQFPRLAGQQNGYLAKQLRDFKSGERKSAPMNAAVTNLSDNDISALAAYLASLDN